MMELYEFSQHGPTTPSDATLTFFGSLATLGIARAIPNLSARLGAVRGPFASVPVVTSVDGGGACYVASFTRMYMDGAADELGASNSLALRAFAPGIAAGGHLARALGMDDIVVINNNLHPTCHVDDWSAIDIGAMTSLLAETHPGDALWMRGLTDRLHGPLIARFKAAGYIITPSRPVDILDPTEADWKITRHLREDLNKLPRLPRLAPFAGGTFSGADFAAMERFSRSATVERHSRLMPQYTAAFFRACAAWPSCRFVGLRDDAQRLRGFATIITGDAFTCGTLGYDLNDEHARRIYPALMVMTMNEAIKARVPFNLGYGAADFKRRRGTTPAMEMNAFYVRHLPFVKRQLWQTTTSAMGALAGPVMRRL